MAMKVSLRALSTVVFVTVALNCAEAESKTLAQWVQLGRDGNASIRAITNGACPSVVFDGTAIEMRARSEPTPIFDAVGTTKSFPVRVCETSVLENAVEATLDGNYLPLPRPNPRRIAIFRDSGCRLTKHTSQACNDPKSWPFPKMAAIAAVSRPDLVIHVGDYVYRQAACPIGNSGCAGSSADLGWDAWNADFFKPAAPLLAVRPLFSFVAIMKIVVAMTKVGSNFSTDCRRNQRAKI